MKRMFAALFLVSIIAAVSTSGLELTRLDEDKESWHVQATRRLERTLEAKGGRDTEQARMLHESLSHHNQARELLRETDLPESVKLKFSAGLDMHEKAVDKAIHDLGVSGHSEVIKIMKRSEESVRRHYYRALSYGAVPPPRPKVEVLRAALLEATGIDATQDADGKLFDIMVEHFGGKPPAAAFGVSAKFFADGRKQTARYHIGLRLPCAPVASDDSARLAASSHAAALALSAPKIVHAWIDAVGDAPVGMGFGFAKLDNQGSNGGKIYVMNLAGKTMPPLPLSLGVNRVFSKTIYDSIPSLKTTADEDHLGARSCLDSQMVSLEWRIGGDEVILRHYAAERGSTDRQRIESSGINADALSSLVSSAGSKTETIAYTAPFRVVEGAWASTPEIVGRKVGMQLPDRTMSDASFLEVADSALSDLVFDKEEVKKWLKASARVPHTISNVQAAATTSGSYVTLYRHPLNVCFESFSPSDDELHARRLMRRQASTDCQMAETKLADSMWGDGSASSKTGTCGSSHATTGACDTCLKAWQQTKGSYIVKNKTACGSGVKSESLGTANDLGGCADLCRKKENNGVQCEYFLYGKGTCKWVFVDLPPAPSMDAWSYPGFDRCDKSQCLEKNLTASSCCSGPRLGGCKEGFTYCQGIQSVCKSGVTLSGPFEDLYTTCCIPNGTCPTRPPPPGQWRYRSQAKVPDLCSSADDNIDLYRQVGAGTVEGQDIGKVGQVAHMPDYCWNVCKDQWLVPCSSTCVADFTDVITKCSGCKGGKNFCVNSGENSENEKKDYFKSKPNIGDGSCKDNPLKAPCVSSVVTFVEAGQNVPNDIGVFVDKVTDADIMDIMTVWSPRQCRPPFYNWWKKDTFLCNECHSVIEESKKAQNMWGGTGFCDYAKECKCPDNDSCDSDEINKCLAAPTPCQCSCRDMLLRAPTVCGANENVSICDPELNAKCAISRCRNDGAVAKWKDKAGDFSPANPFSEVSLWGGDNKCVVGGAFSSSCSNSLQDMNADGKAAYLKRMTSGCRLGAERSCVPDQFKYPVPPPTSKLSNSANHHPASLLAIVNMLLVLLWVSP